MVKKKCMKSYTIFVLISYRQFVSENFEILVLNFVLLLLIKSLQVLKLLKKNLHEFLENSVKKNLTYIVAI